MIKKIITILVLLTLTVGCTNKSDAMKFKEEYEQYNDKNIKLEIEEDNIIKYATSDEINEIIDKKSGVIFIGNPKDDLSRAAINVLLKAAESTDLQEIYYIEEYKEISKIKSIDAIKKPVVINVLEGEIISYHIGTINNKTKLKEENEKKLYDIYSTGIHEVLQDACTEEC